MTYSPEQLPAHDALADADDELGWDRSRHGLMADQSAPDDAVTTVPYDPSNDPFVQEG